MDAERHALLARRLMDACGGPVASADFCRLEKSQLSRFGDPEAGQFMPADVICDLERKAGSPIYSQAIADWRPPVGEIECIVTESMVHTEAAADLQREAREAAKDRTITPAEARRLRRRILSQQEHLRELDATIVKAAGGDLS